jgi:hypothetical protein
MSNKNEIRDEQTILISELLIKVTALENAVVAKGLINNIDIATETKKIVSKLTELMQQNIMDETKKNSGN